MQPLLLHSCEIKLTKDGKNHDYVEKRCRNREEETANAWIYEKNQERINIYNKKSKKREVDVQQKNKPKRFLKILMDNKPKHHLFFTNIQMSISINLNNGTEM